MNLLRVLTTKVPVLFLPLYWLSYLMPRSTKIWVFGSNMGHCFADNPKYFYLFLNEHKHDEVRAVWISSDHTVVSMLREAGFEAYLVHSLKGILIALRAGIYIFDHHTKDICFWLSGGAQKINLFHGIPLKKIHADNKFDKVRNPSNLYELVRWSIRRLQNEKPYHYYLATSEFVRDIFVSAFRSSTNRFFICGYPRNDILAGVEYCTSSKGVFLGADSNSLKAIERWRNSDKKILVYMPTHRKCEHEFLNLVGDFDSFNDYLKALNCVLLVKAHPMSELRMTFDKVDFSNIYRIASDADPYPTLKLSDALITDYSSVYFDYLFLDKPIIFFPYDLRTYIAESRELYFEYDSVTPGPKATNLRELQLCISDVVDGVDHFADERRRLKAQMFRYFDGNASERLYAEIHKKLM